MTRLSRRGFLGFAGLGVGAAALGLAGCAPAPGASLRMAAGERGGTYVQFGELLRDALGRAGGPVLEIIETEGSVENLALLEAGDVDLAIALADSAGLESTMLDVGRRVAVGRVYQNYLQCFVRASAAGVPAIAGVQDLAGRAVSVGAPGSGGAFTARRVLAALGVDPGPTPAVLTELPLDAAVAALAAGEIDAFFWSGGVPLPAVEEEAGLDVAVLDLTAALPALVAAHPDVYIETAVPAGTYGAASAVPSIGVSNLLLANRALPDAVAASVVDVLIGDAEHLVPGGSVGVQFLTASNLIDTSPVALHPGARVRYRELYG